MHHALCIEEVLVRIFSYCWTVESLSSPFRRRVRCFANGHLVALARTCRTFKEPALEMIWAELDDLTPLVRCLDQSEINSEGEYYLSKEHPTQDEWKTVLGYASRVRALPHLHGSLGLSVDCIKMLSNPPSPSSGSIFPKLRVVVLDELSTAVIPIVRHLVNSHLENLSFRSIEGLDPEAVIDTLGQACPNLSEFCMWESASAAKISSLLCCWNNLRSVGCYEVGLNADALSHLSSLPNLCSLKFKVHSAVADRIQTTRSSGSTHTLLTFRALHHVFLSSDSLAPISRLLCCVRFPVIRYLFISLVAFPTANDLASFFPSLQEACSHNSLTDLLLRFYNVRNEPISAFTGNATPLRITFDCLRPLTCFTNIHSISLNICWGVDLNESELLTLASSWPRLEAFHIGNDYDWTPSSAITPAGFLKLLERCRSLKTLYFMLDTRGYTEIPQSHPWRGLTMPQHTFIHLLNSAIETESIQALAVFFHVAPYPNFSLCTHWNDWDFRRRQQSEEQCDLYRSRWEKVCSLSRRLWEERRDIRQSLETRRRYLQ